MGSQIRSFLERESEIFRERNRKLGKGGMDSLFLSTVLFDD